MGRWLIVALSVVGIFVASCGGSSRLSKADYLKRENALDAQVRAAFVSIAPARSPQQVAVALHAAANVVRQAANQQEKVKSPQDAQAVQSDLVKASRQFASQVEALASSPPRSGVAVIGLLRKTPTFIQIERDRAQLKGKGYLPPGP